MTVCQQRRRAMVSVQQLELNFKGALEEVADVPEQANVLALWAEFEQDLSELPHKEQLRVAGSVLSELAGLCEAKSEVLWDDWQDAHNSEGPVMDGDWLSGLTRQTQELDFSDLVNRSYNSRDLPTEEKADEDSVAVGVEKLSVLDMIDSLEDAELKSQALAVSHAENVSDWVKALADKQQDVPQRLVDIQQQLKMPLIEVWIAALLGGFTLEQRGSFYQTQEVWVSGCK